MSTSPEERSWRTPGCSRTRSCSPTTASRSRRRPTCSAALTADRRLRAFLLNTGSGESTDVVVSLTQGSVVSARVVDTAAEGQLPIVDSEYHLVEEIVAADPRVAGGAGPARADRHEQDPDRTDHRRARSGRRPRTTPAGWSACSPSCRPAEHDLAWAHPVDGVTAHVDLIEKKVLRVTDEFQLPVPAESGDYDDPAVRGPGADRAAADRDHPAGGAELHPRRQPAALAGLVAAGGLRPARGAHPARDLARRADP